MMCTDWTTRYPVTASCIGFVTAAAREVRKSPARICQPGAPLDLRHVAVRPADALDDRGSHELRRLHRLPRRRPRRRRCGRNVEREREVVREAPSLALVGPDAGECGAVE